MTTTTFEQSERLVSCGLGLESSDLLFVRRDFNPIINRKEYHGVAKAPCWSLGQLWRVVSQKVKFQFDDCDTPEDIVESLVKLYEDATR